jgi:NodT family efflux transporter outer membrane factor (OMF) lipoprotein
MESPLALPAAFSDSGVEVAPQRWWTAFGDTALTSVVDRALRDNLELRAAWARLRAAEALVGVVGGDRFPDLFLEATGEVRRPDSDGDDDLRLGLSTEYEVDLWGRIGSEVEAERYRARATLADYRTTALALSAEVVRTWFQLAEARAQADLLGEQLSINRTSLTLLEARFGSGQIGSADILRQRQLVEATREQMHVAAARIELLEHRRAVLLGLAPTADIESSRNALPDLPPLPATGLPADLVRRRPDVQSAHHRLAAADRDLAVAISSRYPRLTLSALVSTSGDAPARLFDDWLRSLSGALLTPLFTGGALGADVDRAEARRQELVEQYGQAVLTGFREVEDAMVAERAERRRLESLRAQVALAEQTYGRLRLEYLNGFGNFLDVLTAQTAQQRLERDLLASKLALLQNRIELYRALAGGFDAAPDPERPRESAETPAGATVLAHEHTAVQMEDQVPR